MECPRTPTDVDSLSKNETNQEYNVSHHHSHGTSVVAQLLVDVSK